MAPGIKVDSNPEDASMRHLRGFKTGSWLSYLIDVPQADGYLLQFRFQADAGAKPGIVIKNGSGEVLQRICDCVLDSAVSDSGGWLVAAVPLPCPRGGRSWLWSSRARKAWPRCGLTGGSCLRRSKRAAARPPFKWNIGASHSSPQAFHWGAKKRVTIVGLSRWEVF